MKQQFDIYQVDAFTDQVLAGNPAAVIPLAQWLPDERLQAIAQENNLSETAFTVPLGHDHFHLRWFTPTKEVRLCGHATLATAHVFFEHRHLFGDQIRFTTLSGDLTVERVGPGRYQMDFPADMPQSASLPVELITDADIPVVETYQGLDDFLVIVPDADMVRSLTPDMTIWGEIPMRGVIVSARGEDTDVISRCFYPRYGVPEDPVTGSAHTLLTPYWTEVLGQSRITALQASPRGGFLDCELRGDRVLLTGSAVTFLVGSCFL
jgi:PhzF family phenazine biosynthesis protein